MVEVEKIQDGSLPVDLVRYKMLVKLIHKGNEGKAFPVQAWTGP
jgi:hypothetical protein